jgi:hypothetical protein
MKRMGFNVQCASLTHTSLASRVRNGVKTLSNFDAVQEQWNLASTSDDRTLWCDEFTWLGESCFQAIKSAITIVRSKGCQISPPRSSGLSVQKAINLKLIELDVFSPVEFLNRRLARFFTKGTYETFTADLIGHYSTLSKYFKASIMTSHLRSCCNQWCTTRRFGQPSLGCPFGCGSPLDDIEHCIVCDRFQDVYHGVFRCRELRLTYFDVFLLRDVDGELPDDLRKYIIIYVHVAYLLYNACRHGKSLSPRAVTHYLKRVSTHCRRARAWICKWRRFSIR